MLRTNLATRPFYNERAVYMALVVVAVVGLAVMASLVLQIVDLSARNTELTARAERAGREGAELSAQAAEIQRTVSPQALDEVAAAAREANLLIDQRVFSWTAFFNRIEVTLPSDVMMTEVRPDIEPGTIEVTMGVIGRRLDAINEFIRALEGSGAFRELLERQSEITEDGMYRAVLRGQYLQAPASEAAGLGESDGNDEVDEAGPEAADLSVEPEPDPPVPGRDLP